jgi:hypothetical protein
MKICTICKQSKAPDDFNKRRKSKDGLQPQCRICSAKRSKLYYSENREKHKGVAARNRNKTVLANRIWMLSYLKQNPCIDCGNTDIRVLEFDHITGQKRNGVGQMLRNGCSLESILSEIDKCEVRCRNCHVIKTYERIGGSWHTILNEVT